MTKGSVPGSPRVSRCRSPATLNRVSAPSRERASISASAAEGTRTADACARLSAEGAEAGIRERTGLPVATYFSATKLAWLLDNVPGARHSAQRSEVMAGTIDVWLVWNLTGAHVTDVTNASRTQLMNLRTLAWDEELLKLFNIPSGILPEIVSSSDAHAFGVAFDIDYIKIDQSFIRNLTPASTDLALCKAIIAMAHSLDLRVTAEGVETQGQLAALRKLRCDQFQGYLLSPAIPADEFARRFLVPDSAASSGTARARKSGGPTRKV